MIIAGVYGDSTDKYVCQFSCNAYKPGEKFTTKCDECTCEDSGDITCKGLPDIACPAVIADHCESGDTTVEPGKIVISACPCGGTICTCICDHNTGEMVCNNKNATCDNDYWEKINSDCAGK